jgi:transposase-like protein
MSAALKLDPAALRAALDAGKSPELIAAELGVSSRTVRRWVAAHLPELIGQAFLRSPAAPALAGFIFTRSRRLRAVTPPPPKEHDHG